MGSKSHTGTNHHQYSFVMMIVFSRIPSSFLKLNTFSQRRFNLHPYKHFSMLMVQQKYDSSTLLREDFAAQIVDFG